MSMERKDAFWLLSLIIVAFLCFELGMEYEQSYAFLNTKNNSNNNNFALREHQHQHQHQRSNSSSSKNNSEGTMVLEIDASERHHDLIEQIKALNQEKSRLHLSHFYERCEASFKQNNSENNSTRRHRTQEEIIGQNAPPLLVGYGGSGLLYMRLLLEMITGIYTGSLGTGEGIADDNTFLSYFQEENTCDFLQAVVQLTHPKYFSGGIGTMSKIGNVYLNQKKHRKRCRHGVIYGFKRILMVSRNPVEAILADYFTQQYFATRNQLSKTNNNKDNNNNNNTFDDNVIDENWLKTIDFVALTHFFQTSAEDLGRSWEVNLFPVIEALLPDQLLELIRYEDLISTQSRVRQLNSALTFTMGKRYNDDVLLCAFHLLETQQQQQHMVVLKEQLSSDVFSTLLSTPEFVSILKNTEITNHLLLYMQNMSYSLPICIRGVMLPCFNGTTVIQPQQDHQQDHHQQQQQGAAMIQKMVTCSSEVGKRMFKPDPSLLPEDQVNLKVLQLPTPLLLSYPGSGNTWTRLLIEYGSGIFSGSIDLSDSQLQKEIIGEKYCDERTAVIKAHPVNVAFNVTSQQQQQQQQQQQPLAIGLVESYHREKCRSIANFTRVVFIKRNPYNAILAEFQRQRTSSHSGTLEATHVSERDWWRSAVAIAQSYAETWEKSIHDIVSLLPPSQLKIVSYEKLLNPSQRHQELLDMLQFIGYTADMFYLPSPSSSTTTSSSVLSQQQQQQSFISMSARRLDCVFQLSFNPKVYREKSSHSLNATFAYRNESLVQEMWLSLKPFATFMGYSMGPATTTTTTTTKRRHRLKRH